MTDLIPSCIYDIDCIDLQGRPFSLRHQAGRPLLIVNTASICSFSSQFGSLEMIWQRNRDKGLMVLGVPSNDFGHQEPGSSSQIISLCSTKFGVTFPFLAKTSVTGPNAHPLFRLLSQEGGTLARPRWNFYKYIVGKDGHLSDWFSSLTKPDHQRFQKALTKALN